jgi:hypothetical protein
VHGKKALANAPVIPLKWQGIVATHSSVKLGGGGAHKGGTKTLTSPAGKLTVKIIAKPTTSQSENAKSCRFSFTEYIVLTVLGSKSTGAFAGAAGPGAVQVKFAATEPRFKSGANKGECNPNAEPIASTAVASFLASVVLTVN